MNLDIENISSTIQQIWRSIYEGIDDSDFKAVTQCLEHCKKIGNEPQNIPSEVKTA